MDSLVQFLRNPFSFNYDFDRNRRNQTVYYGYYKPTKLKILMIWLMNEKIDPIDWEEVPQFTEEDTEESLLSTRDGTVKYYECYSQPDMLTMRDIYIRRFFLFGVFYFIYRHLEKKFYAYKNSYGMGNFYYRRYVLKIFLLGWFYYMTCRIYVHKDYQLPYN